MGEMCDHRQCDPCPVQGPIMNSIVLQAHLTSCVLLKACRSFDLLHAARILLLSVATLVACLAAESVHL